MNIKSTMVLGLIILLFNNYAISQSFKLPWNSGISYYVSRTGTPVPTGGNGSTCFMNYGFNAHNYVAIDFDSPNSVYDPVRAVAAGTVIFAGISGSLTSGYGRLVKIQHSDGTITYYAHNEEIYVSVNDVVQQGCIIADGGTTGNSSGDHIHFEWRDAADAAFSNNQYPSFLECSCVPKANYCYTSTNANGSCGTPCTAPSNDNCSSSVPTLTSNGACANGTVACATGSYGANQCLGCSCTSPDDKDVYYKFTAQATSHTVTLSNYASNFDGVIELRTACASGTAISCYDPSGAPSTVSNTWNNLTIGQTYYIRVFEYNNTGTPPSSPTFTICLTHSGGTTCNTPSNMAESNITQTSATLSWSSVSTATSYTLQYRVNGTSIWTTVNNISNTSYPLSGLTCGTSYDWRVLANCSNGSSSSYSSTRTFPTNACPSTCTDQFESNNSANAATLVFANPLNSGSSNYTLQGNMGFAGDQDWYRVNIQACGTLTVNLSNLPLNYDLELWNAAANTTLSGSYNTGTSNEQVTFTSTSSSLTHVYVKVYANNSNNFSTATCYNLQFVWTPGNCPCTPPTPSISPSTATICSGNSIQLTASGGTSYAWSNGANTAATTVSPTSNTTYTVTVTNSGGCTATASRTVNVNSSPSASISPSSASICTGGSIQLTVSGGTSYSWSNGATTAAITVSPSSNTTYTVTVTNSNGCTATATRTVTVNSAPTASISPSTATVCSGNSIQLTASGGTNYLWSNGAITAATSVNPTTNTTYSVTVTNSGGCTATASKLVTVTQTPTVSVNPPSASICSGGSGTTLQATGNAQSYSWSPSTGLNTTTGQTVIANPTSQTTYTVTASNGNCSATASSTVTVSNQLTASINPANPEFCANGSVLLSATSGTAYSWSGPNGFSASSQTVNVSNTGSYSVTVTNPGGCNGTASASVIVTQNPALLVDAGTTQTIQSGSSAQLGGSPTASGGTPPYTYTWSPSASLDNAGASNPNATPTTNTTYSLTVTDSKGCSATDNVQVSVSSGCQSYTLDSDTLNIPSGAATYTVNLTTGAGCTWTVAEGCSWLDFTTTSGNGSATLEFTVTQNPSSQRTCFVNVQGVILLVIQAGCTAPISDFSASQQAGFSPFTVSFSDNSTNTPTQWEWTFPGGDPATSNTQNPTVTYANGGLFDVTLKVTNSCGSNTVTKTNYINVIGTVGIDNLAFSESINIYPNPNNGTFNVTAKINTANSVGLKLFSAIGQLVYNSTIDPVANKIDKEISVSNIAAGVYIIQLVVDKKPLYKKLVIE